MKIFSSFFKADNTELIQRIQQLEQSVQIIARAHNVVDAREQALRKHFGLVYIKNKKGTTFLRKARTPHKRKYTKRAVTPVEND